MLLQTQLIRKNIMNIQKILASTSLLVLANTASAALIAYEGFDYSDPIGTTVGGLNGGTGWDEAFPNPDGPHTLAAGLTFSTLPTVGGAMLRTNGTMTTDGRNWAPTIAATSYWYSFLLNSSGAEGTFGLFQSTGSNQNGTGIEIRRASGDTETLIRATGNGGVNDVRTVPNNQTHLVLGHITGNNNTVWVYAAGEPVPTVAPTTGGITNFGSALTGKSPSLYGRRYGSSAGNVIFDEIRLGTEFIDVVPIPEPSTALLVLAAPLLALRRRR